MTIKGVVFDFGGVLAWPPSSERCDLLAAATGVPKKELIKRYYRGRPEFDRGAMSSLEYWCRVTDGFLAPEAVPALKLDHIDVEMWSEFNATTVGWLPSLQEDGYSLSILSNMPKPSCDIFEAEVPWMYRFDVRVFSGKVRCNKPDRGIYHHLLDGLAGQCIHAEELLFLDDSERNVLAARTMGMHAEIYSVFIGGLRDIAERYGLPVPDEVPVEESRIRDTECAPPLSKQEL